MRTPADGPRPAHRAEASGSARDAANEPVVANSSRPAGPREATVPARDAASESVAPSDRRPAARTHGGLLEAELQALGLAPADVLDFSTSCNPYGPCPAVADAARTAPLDRYPDPSAYRARVALSELLGCTAAELVLGNGAAELLWSLARATLRPGASALIVEPTFGEFRAAAERAGARVHEWRAQPSAHFTIDLRAALERARACAAELIYVCAPNTPAGTPLPSAEVGAAAAAHPDLTFALDQSFLSLSTRFSDLSCSLPANVACVRSLTKEQGIPGVRVGYLRASSELCRRVERERPAWSTSAQAQAAAIAACDTQAFVADSRERLLHAREALERGLRALGLTPEPSSTGFVLVRTGAAAALRERLLQRHRILVRNCDSFGLPDFIRLAARPDAELERLLHALREELRC